MLITFSSFSNVLARRGVQSTSASPATETSQAGHPAATCSATLGSLFSSSCGVVVSSSSSSSVSPISEISGCFSENLLELNSTLASSLQLDLSSCSSLLWLESSILEELILEERFSDDSFLCWCWWWWWCCLFRDFFLEMMQPMRGSTLHYRTRL